MIKKGLVNKNQMKTAGKAYAGMKVFHQGLCCISLASELSFQEAQGAVKWVKKSGLRPIQLTCCSSEILVAVRGCLRHLGELPSSIKAILRGRGIDRAFMKNLYVAMLPLLNKDRGRETWFFRPLSVLLCGCGLSGDGWGLTHQMGLTEKRLCVFLVAGRAANA